MWRLTRLSSATLAGVVVLAVVFGTATRSPGQAPAPAKKPNILVIFGDDVGQSDISAYTMGLMGFRTPNIDRIAQEGMIFTDYYAEQSCTAGRSSFITGQTVLRTGLSKVGLPGADIGLRRNGHPSGHGRHPLSRSSLRLVARRP